MARHLLKCGEVELDAPRAARLRAGAAELCAQSAAFRSPREAAQLGERRGRLEALGLPAELAAAIAALPLADRGLNVLRIRERLPVPLLEVARVHGHLAEATGIDWVYGRLLEARPTDLWERMVRVDLRWSLLDLQRELTETVLADKPADPMAAASAFLEAKAEVVAQVDELRKRALGVESPSALLVVAQRLQALRRR